VHQVLSYIRIREADGRTYSKQYNTYLPNSIDRLLKFGPAVLSEEELHARLSHYWAKYYDYLAASALLLREKGFWAFHRDKMERMGQPLSLPRLALAISSKIMDYLFNPKRTIEGLWRKARCRVQS
jgi:hypothetical protein